MAAQQSWRAGHFLAWTGAVCAAGARTLRVTIGKAGSPVRFNPATTQQMNVNGSTTTPNKNASGICLADLDPDLS